jgi:Endosomal/lysosomal potassium channel TMEM175
VRQGDELGAGSGLTREERRRDPSRVLALTDGVYAIIITLLVLDIQPLPFGSALLSRYPQDPVALRMFGLILMATSLTRTAIWAYAARRPSVVHEPIDRASFWSGLALSVFPLAIYVAAFAVAGVSAGPAWPCTPRRRCCTSSRSRCHAGWLLAARPNASSPSRRAGRRAIRAGVSAGGSGPGP